MKVQAAVGKATALEMPFSIAIKIHSKEKQTV